jgi:hypothetical protein
MASAALGVVLCAAAPPAAGRALDGATTGHPIERIAAGSDRLFALGGGEVMTFDARGRLLSRCERFAAAPRAEHPEHGPPPGAPDADEVLRAAGLPDDDSTPAAEEALEDEGLGHRRARISSEAGIVPRALAAGADGVWIATSSGVFRGDDSGCRSVGLDGRDLLLVAAARGDVVMATEDLLFRRARGDADGVADGDDTFTVVAGLAERPRALALDAAGAALVADDDGVLVVGGDGSVERILDRPTDALAVCDGQAVALANDGVYRWSPGGEPLRTGDRPPVRGIACGPGPEVEWIATGLGIWTSTDAGTWSEQPAAVGRRVASATTLGERCWLAIDDQLSSLDLDASRPDGTIALRPSPLAAGAGPAPISNRRLVAPTLPWPWVTALFGAEQRTPARRGWEVMLLLTFPLGRRGSRHGDVAARAAARVRRDEALAREETDLALDPAGDAETDARLEALQQEREALR